MQQPNQAIVSAQRPSWTLSADHKTSSEGQTPGRRFELFEGGQNLRPNSITLFPDNTMSASRGKKMETVERGSITARPMSSSQCSSTTTSESEVKDTDESRASRPCVRVFCHFKMYIDVRMHKYWILSGERETICDDTRRWEVFKTCSRCVKKLTVWIYNLLHNDCSSMNDRSIAVQSDPYWVLMITVQPNTEMLNHCIIMNTSLVCSCTMCLQHLSFVLSVLLSFTHLYTVHVHNIASVRHFVKCVVLNKMA